MSNRYFITGGFWLPSVGCWLRVAFGAVPWYGGRVVRAAAAAGRALCVLVAVGWMGLALGWPCAGGGAAGWMCAGYIIM